MSDLGKLYWTSVSISSDGSKMVAATLQDGIFRSVNSGVTWTLTSAPKEYLPSITLSSDGSKLAVAYGYGAGIYKSFDAGDSWTQTSADAQLSYESITSSSDGLKVAVCQAGDVFINNGDLGPWTLSLKKTIMLCIVGN